MEITKDVRTELDSWQVCELERVLDALARQEESVTGLHSINGGYATASAYEIVEGDDYDSENEKYTDAVLIELEAGEQDMGDGRSSCNKVQLKISAEVLKSHELSLKEKLEKVKEA